jgi:serine O-acetyltransferase
MQAMRDRGMGRLALLVELRIQKRFGVFVSRYARIAPSVSFPHPTGIVIGEGVVIAHNVTVYQNVTLGGARMGDWHQGNYPEIGAGTVLFAGVVAVGKLHIGQNCVIGANAVVLQDLPDNAVAAGAPARIVKMRKTRLKNE